MLKKNPQQPTSALCVSELWSLCFSFMCFMASGDAEKKHYMLFTFSHFFSGKNNFFSIYERSHKNAHKDQMNNTEMLLSITWWVFITVHIGCLCGENWTFINDFLVLSQNLNPVELFLMMLFSWKPFYSPVSIIVSSQAFMLNSLNSKCTIPQRLRSKKGFNVQ